MINAVYDGDMNGIQTAAETKPMVKKDQNWAGIRQSTCTGACGTQKGLYCVEQ